jgi:hypothetical protein
MMMPGLLVLRLLFVGLGQNMDGWWHGCTIAWHEWRIGFSSVDE